MLPYALYFHNVNLINPDLSISSSEQAAPDTLHQATLSGTLCCPHHLLSRKIVGGIYDDRFLVKPTKSAVAMMPDADMELPYEGAKEMLLVDDVENREFLRKLLDAMYPELPVSKKR